MSAFKFDDFVFDDELVSLCRNGVASKVDGQLLRPLDFELERRAERLQLHARHALQALDWAELQRQTSDVQSADSKLSDYCSHARPSHQTSAR
jgi:hypothetical protein